MVAAPISPMPPPLASGANSKEGMATGMGLYSCAGNKLLHITKRQLHKKARIVLFILNRLTIDGLVARQIYFILKSNNFFSPMYPSKWSSIFTGPTPAGVPVKIKSPIFSVKNRLIYEIILSTE